MSLRETVLQSELFSSQRKGERRREPHEAGVFPSSILFNVQFCFLSETLT